MMRYGWVGSMGRSPKHTHFSLFLLYTDACIWAGSISDGRIPLFYFFFYLLGTTEHGMDITRGSGSMKGLNSFLRELLY
jgi:hypothetical protein